MYAGKYDECVPKNSLQEQKERIERREFKLLLALIHKLKSAAAVLERI